MITPQQQRFFDVFGFLHFPQLVEDRIAWISEQFEQVFAQRNDIAAHDGTRRTCVFPFIDQREEFCALLDDPRIVGIAGGLLGDDFNYLGGDGNYYVGDTGWHSDGWHTDTRYIKIALYLDPVGRDSGCLRVIPGSHRIGEGFAEAIQQVTQAREAFGVAPADVPAVALESRPGDVVVFNHNIKHAAFGGGTRRRMFTLNLCEQCRTPAQQADLREYINNHARFWVDQIHTDAMRRTASPERMRHLQQVIDFEGELPALARQAREATLEPARG